MTAPAWFPKTSAQAARIITAAERIAAQFPEGMMTCSGTGMVAVRVEDARELVTAVEEGKG